MSKERVYLRTVEEYTAIQWTGDNIVEVFQFMAPIEPIYAHGFRNADEIVLIDTKEGRIGAKTGDYIVRNRYTGELSVYHPDRFKSAFEEREAKEAAQDGK